MCLYWNSTFSLFWNEWLLSVPAVSGGESSSCVCFWMSVEMFLYLHRELQWVVAVFWFCGCFQLPVGPAAEDTRADEHDEDFGSDPPRSDLERRDTDAQRPAQVTTHIRSSWLCLGKVLESPGTVSWCVCFQVGERRSRPVCERLRGTPWWDEAWGERRSHLQSRGQKSIREREREKERDL